MGPFLDLTFLFQEQFQPAAGKLIIGNKFLSTIQDFVTMRLKQAHIFKLIQILISKEVIRNKGESWVNTKFIRNYLK